MSDQILDEALKMFEPKQTAPTISEYAVRAVSDDSEPSKVIVRGLHTALSLCRRSYQLFNDLDCAITLNRLAGGLERIYSRAPA